MRIVRNLILLLCIAASGFVSWQTAALAQPLLQYYGRVELGISSRRAGMAPVAFDHWLHRAWFTCRLCHVDIGFAMQKNATGIRAAGNMQGYYCGACHNGKMLFRGREVFASCSEKTEGQDMKRCGQCHSQREAASRMYDFNTFTRDFPRAEFGNRVDWEKAEAEGIVRPVDYLEGSSMKRAGLKPQEDFSIEAKEGWMEDVLFSHRKHAVWNGCEVCHPEIFPSTSKGTVKYTMLDLTFGKYCGVCHDKVAFPLVDCARCHTKPVK